MGIAGIIAAVGGLASAGASVVNTIGARDAAGKTQAEETQLIAEANQSLVNQKEQQGLIDQRTAEENALHPINTAFDANKTLLSGGPSLSSANPPPTMLLGQ